MSFRPASFFTLFIVVVSGFVVATASHWPLETRRFPQLIGWPMFFASLVQLCLEMYRARKFRNSEEKTAEFMDLEVDFSLPTVLVTKRASRFFGWLLGLLAGIWLFGFLIAIPTFNLLYLKLEAKRGWLLSVALSGATLIFLIGVFDQVLHIPWPEPFIPGPELIMRRMVPFID